MKRLLTAVLALLTVVAIFSLPVAASDTVRVYEPEGTDLLSAGDEAALAAKLEALSAETGLQMYLATYIGSSYTDEFTGDDYCYRVQNLRAEDAILLVITRDRYDGMYYYNIYTYGKANTAISDKEINFILDHEDVYYNLKRGNLRAGAEAMFDLSKTAYEGRLGVSWVVIILVSAAISILIGVGVCIGVEASYKRKNPAANYPLDRFAKLDLQHESDTFEGKAVTRTYIPRSSGGPGGRGGSAHGGGGGHRGGR